MIHSELLENLLKRLAAPELYNMHGSINTQIIHIMIVKRITKHVFSLNLFTILSIILGKDVNR
jgi:hypothetical protein